MSRRKPHQAPEPVPVAIPLLLDRILVGAFAALVVARPLVAGDDPGRLRLTSGSSAVSFNFCLFLVLLGAILWRAAYGRGLGIRSAVVPVLLAGVGVAAFVSSQLGDRYARPGIFIAWEWIALSAAVLLTRGLVSSIADSRGLLNVLLATAVSVAGLGVYQALSDSVGLPTVDVTVPPESVTLAGDDEFYPVLNRPIAMVKTTRGTLDSPESLLLFMFLMLPAGLALARAGRGDSRGRWAVAIPVVLAAGAVAALLAGPFEIKGNPWSAGFDQVGRNPILGIGPGNFSRVAPDVLVPHSAWLGLAATIGLVGFGLFTVAVVLALRASWPPLASDKPEPLPTKTRWEFYLGGIGGLILGFVWLVGDMPAEAPPNEIFKLGASAIIRAVLWLGAFALLETVRANPRALCRAILVGVTFVFGFGLVSDSAGLPTLLFPMWVMLALAMNFRDGAPAVVPEGKWTRPILLTGVTAALGLAIVFFVMAALPAWATSSGVRQARMSSRNFAEKYRQVGLARSGPERANAHTAASRVLAYNILNPMLEAAFRDPGNAALWLEISHWRRPLWEYELRADPEAALRVADQTLRAADRADRLDAKNPAAKRNLFEALLLFRDRSSVLETERVFVLKRLVGQLAERDPTTEVLLRYRLLIVQLDRGGADELKPEITMLFELNRQKDRGQLTADQKLELINQAKRVMRDLPTKVLEEWAR
jgi:hypothetical protein